MAPRGGDSEIQPDHLRLSKERLGRRGIQQQHKATGGGDFGGTVSGTHNFTTTGGTRKMISIPIWPDTNPDTKSHVVLDS